MHLNGKRILLGITGSIAAYKSILLLRLLIRQGAEVKVLLTPSAKEFVSPLVLATLSKNDVLVDLTEQYAWSNHVMLGQWSDLMVIAPLSCNTLSKMATGLCDNLMMAVYLSAACPVLVCPAMDEEMWKHASTRRNINQVRQDGVEVMDVGYGELGSGLTGEGRMAEPEAILNAVIRNIAYVTKPLSGLKALITAGPTYEMIDPVRFIGNRSSGLMGIAIANELYFAGAEVKLVLGPSSLKPVEGIETVCVESAMDMFEAATSGFETADIGVFAAAVSDFRPSVSFDEKWKKDSASQFPPLEFEKNPDILKHCGWNKKAGQTVVGFALETNNEELNAVQKMKNKKASIIILNSLRDTGAGFGYKTNKISILDDRGGKLELPLQLKEKLAVDIVKSIINYRNT